MIFFIFFNCSKFSLGKQLLFIVFPTQAHEYLFSLLFTLNAPSFYIWMLKCCRELIKLFQIMHFCKYLYFRASKPCTIDGNRFSCLFFPQETFIHLHNNILAENLTPILENTHSYGPLLTVDGTYWDFYLVKQIPKKRAV